MTILRGSAVTVAGLFLLGAAQFVVGPELQAAEPELSCGRAFIDFDTRDGPSVVHSCVGSGTVQYTVPCDFGSFQFSHRYQEPGASISRPVECVGLFENVEWDIV